MHRLRQSLTIGAVLLAATAVAANAQPASFGHGSYRGTIADLPAAAPASAATPACTGQRPASLRIEHGRATILYRTEAGYAVRYRGAVTPAGGIVAWHVNGDGSRSLLSGRFEGAEFTGYVDGGHEPCPAKVIIPAAPPAP